MFLQEELKFKDDYIKVLLKQLSKQSNIIYSFQVENLKLERFSAVKEAVSNSPTVHLIQLTLDDQLDPLGNREVPSCDENRLVNHNDTTDSSYRNRTDKKLSMIKHRKGYKMPKKVVGCQVFMRSFGRAKVWFMKDYMKPTI